MSMFRPCVYRTSLLRAPETRSILLAPCLNCATPRFSTWPERSITSGPTTRRSPTAASRPGPHFWVGSRRTRLLVGRIGTIRPRERKSNTRRWTLGRTRATCRFRILAATLIVYIPRTPCNKQSEDSASWLVEQEHTLQASEVSGEQCKCLTHGPTDTRDYRPPQ